MPNMAEKKEEAPDSGEPVCVLCGRAQVNPDICGQTFASGGLCAHEFCLVFANGLLEWRCPVGEIFGFPISAIQRTVQLAGQKNCFVCGERGAAISCAETGCERSFHLPCAEDGQCVTQHFGPHRSFCWEHRPRQAAEAAPSQNTICVICLEPVGDSTSYHTMVCPVCKQAWFHRGCIRKHALHAATMRFFCPVCGGKTRFRSQMTTLGIQIPVRRPSWWDDAAYQLLRESHRRCDASPCIYVGGRERAQEKGLWQLLICSSCGSEGTHWCCSFWALGRNGWECDTCAGRSTAPRSSAELASPSTSSQEVPAPSPASAATNRPRQRETGRTRSRSPLQGRASGSQSRPRRQRGGSRTTARGTQGGTRTSATPAAPTSSRASPLPARRGRPRQGRGRAPTRSRSPVGRRASTSHSRSRRGRGSRSRQQGPAQARSHCRANHPRRRPHGQSQRRR
ncbi:PHD finger protein 7-like [Centrocercus urophasianus]|uniref:PHD finger protein 7-like n=1 Tax=Centrocercus urophasianus TaxID=9002 RepID=UPI001C64F7F5|nr:PHD finger protein 7-like [Centrocercus urophasianus]